MAAAAALAGSIMSDVEVGAMVAVLLPLSDQLRRLFDGASSADRKAAAIASTADFDACFWDGEPTASDQVHAFPRLGTTAIETEAAIPAGAGFTGWSTPGIPWGIRAAHSIQTCVHLARSIQWPLEGMPTWGGHPWDALFGTAQTAAARFRRSMFEGA